MKHLATGLCRYASGGLIVAALTFGAGPRVAFAAEQLFTLGRASLSLSDDSSNVNVRYQSMRLNRALNVWNVEVTIENKSARTLRGPFVLVVDSFTGTSGARFTDGSAGGPPAAPSVKRGPLVPVKLSTESTNGPRNVRALLFSMVTSTFHTLSARFVRIDW